ncbi:hypothetical protein K470DRAFT_161900 [Piedraia hortae CBS 480.64]|uniref:Uncharacterized protein n=1 Tax=Piedraia hortae CBS 480.64 TaxID=1314780 RepID=A0A6A7BSE0_9PEZI|nr:hypothetical protein K470DRAFT_161900 [Piedraia hortae CBS 480.64]
MSNFIDIVGKGISYKFHSLQTGREDSRVRGRGPPRRSNGGGCGRGICQYGERLRRGRCFRFLSPRELTNHGTGNEWFPFETKEHLSKFLQHHSSQCMVSDKDMMSILGIDRELGLSVPSPLKTLKRTRDVIPTHWWLNDNGIPFYSISLPEMVRMQSYLPDQKVVESPGVLVVGPGHV